MFALAAFIGAVAWWQSGDEGQHLWEARTQPLLIELDEFLQVPLQEIRVIPVFSSNENFAYSIDSADELALFRESADRADAEQVSGHSGALFEADLILINADRQIRFLASVHKYEPHDLFLGRRWERKNPDGRSFESGPPLRIRVPAIG